MAIQKIFENIGLNSSCFFILILIIFTKSSIAQDDVIRVDTNLVSVPVTVFDRDGRYITNLKKEDFQIFEDGVEQLIEIFETTEQPFTVMLLLDNSGSMNNYLLNIALAANTFVKELRPNDQLIVANFSDSGKIQIILEAAKKKDFQTKILLQKRIGDYFTTTFDAVKHGIEYMKPFKGRRAIVLFSDGELYGKKASAKSNLRDAEEQEALIYTLRFGEYPTHQPGYAGYFNKKNYDKLVEKVNNYMQGLAQATGGRSYQIENVEDLEDTFAQVAAELRQQYSLSYYPKQVEKEQKQQIRQIKVKVNQPNLAVRSRNSYVVKSN